MISQEISQSLLDKYKKVTSATVYGGVRRLGFEPCFMRGVQAFTPGKMLVARARTLRFIPPRPDIIAEVHRGEDSPVTVFAGDRTPMGGADEVDPFVDDVTIQCGGVAVRPGDLLVGDDDGVVVVPKQVAEEVIDWVEEHEAVEEYIKGLIERENVAPGKYYPITDDTVRRYHESRGG